MACILNSSIIRRTRKAGSSISSSVNQAANVVNPLGVRRSISYYSIVRVSAGRNKLMAENHVAER